MCIACMLYNSGLPFELQEKALKKAIRIIRRQYGVKSLLNI